MCKHILNAQVAIRAPCCKEWFDCSQCHTERKRHPLEKSTKLEFICKKCKRAFRKNSEDYQEADEHCPHCDNHYVIEAKTPKAAVSVESEDVRIDNKMLKDERTRQRTRLTWIQSAFDPDSDADKLG